MSTRWSIPIIAIIIANLVFSPTALAASGDTSFFAHVGALLRGDTTFVQLWNARTAQTTASSLATAQQTALIARNEPALAYTPLSDEYRLHTVTITAYSSSVDETDSTPFITASNTRTRDGVVAANFLPFGTKVKIPELFGDKVFVVEDRMHRRFSDRLDIWFPSKGEAKQFGKRKAQIVAFTN